ncbi:MAG: sulfotransferase, partial [Gammaproteobacteria bacterium]|nr:sulfotransferase [Gammaproteobacteria bacterium]
EALSMAPNNPIPMHHLALLYMANNKAEKAIPYLTRASELHPDNAKLLYNLGLAYQSCNEIQAAIHFYQLSTERDAQFVQAFNNLGVAYQHLGKLELANTYLAKAFEIDPTCSEAYYNFSQSHKFTEQDTPLIARIESLLEQQGLHKTSEIKLHFALGKIYDDLKNYSTAFRHFETANALKYQGFDNKAINNYIDTIIATYTPERIKQLTARINPSKKRFIFVVGMPRSGTTLVEQIISSHPLIQSGGEIGFIGDIIDELPDMIDSHQGYPQCIEAFNASMIGQISQKFNIYLNNLGGNFSNITDKSPINFLHLGLIKMLFPQSIIIHVTREPVATCLSCYFQNFDKQHQYSYNMNTLTEFYLSYTRIMSHWKSLFGDEIYDISYETLVSDAEQQMKDLISHCDLNWDESCEKYYNQPNVVSSASKWQARQPIYTNSIEKWKNYQPYIQGLCDKLGKI